MLVIGIFIGFALGFTTCALISANRVHGEVYYVDMSQCNNDNDYKGDEDDE